VLQDQHVGDSAIEGKLKKLIARAQASPGAEADGGRGRAGQERELKAIEHFRNSCEPCSDGHVGLFFQGKGQPSVFLRSAPIAKML
jgi:hypothetical protein